MDRAARASRVVLHADMDAFYASIEQRDRPELRGRPVIVAGLSNRGVVSAASYEARRFGVRSAMPTVEARRRCPDGAFLPGSMPRYVRESRRLFAIFQRFTPRVEGLSLDEAFLDLTGTERLLGPPRTVGEALRRSVRRELDLPVSVGIAPSKLVAKIASDVAKPDGLREVQADEVGAFLEPLPVSRLWGVGPVAEEKLLAAGIRTLGDLARADTGRLTVLLGPFGASAGWLARGEDPRDVEPDRAPVSYSEENTFAEDVSDRGRLAATLLAHAESVARRIRRDGVRARTVVLKVRLGRRASGARTTGAAPQRAAWRRGYPLLTRRRTLPEPTDDGATLTNAARALLARMPDEPVRLLGVGVTNLEGAADEQLPLFAASTPAARNTRLNRALDAIAARFGPRAVLRAGQVNPERAGLSLQIKRGEDEDGRVPE